MLDLIIQGIRDSGTNFLDRDAVPTFQILRGVMGNWTILPSPGGTPRDLEALKSSLARVDFSGVPEDFEVALFHLNGFLIAIVFALDMSTWQLSDADYAELDEYAKVLRQIDPHIKHVYVDNLVSNVL